MLMRLRGCKNNLNVEQVFGIQIMTVFFIFRSQLEKTTHNFCELVQSHSQMSDELTKQIATSIETKSRYETEVMRCGQTTKTVKELRDKLNAFTEEKAKLESDKKHGRETIEGLKKNCAALQDKLACLKSQHTLVHIYEIKQDK